MNPNFQNAVALAARVLLSLLFISAGFNKITGFSGTAGYMASKGIPFAEVLLVGTIIIEVAGGLMAPSPEVAQSEVRLARFRREAHLLAPLNHPNIAAIYGLEEAEGKPLLVLSGPRFGGTSQLGST